MRDITGVVGVIISRNGYQSGAKQFADNQGIFALTPDELLFYPIDAQTPSYSLKRS
jgi:hypothetical protein